MAVTYTLTGTSQNVTAVVGSNAVTATDTTGWVVGATVQGTGWAAGTKIVSFVANTSGVFSNNFTGVAGVTAVVVSSNTGTLTITLAASGDTAGPSNVIAAGFGALIGNKTIQIYGATKLILQIATGAIWDCTEWNYELGSGSSLRMNETYGCGTWIKGYKLVGSTYIPAAGGTINYTNFDGSNNLGGRNIFFNSGAPTGYPTTKPTLRWNDVSWVVQSGTSNGSAFATPTYSTWNAGKIVMDYYLDSAGANAGIGGSFGTISEVSLLRVNSSISKGADATSLVSIGKLNYYGLQTSSGASNPDIKFNIPNNTPFYGWAPIFWDTTPSNEYFGFFTTAGDVQLFVDPVIPSGYNVLNHTLCFSANNIRAYQRTVTFNMFDSTATALTNTTLYITSGSSTMVNAVQSGNFSSALDYARLSWDSRSGAYRIPSTTADTRSQTAQIRKNGYIQQVVSYNIEYSAYTQPIFMLADTAYGSVTATAAAALTGITPNYGNQILEVSSSHTMDEVYAYGGYSLALPANSQYANYQTSSGGAYSLVSPWSMQVISGNLTMGSYNKTINGSKQFLAKGNTVAHCTSGALWGTASNFWNAGETWGVYTTYTATTSVTLNKVDSVWTPASRSDMWQIGSGATLNLNNGATMTFSPTGGLGYGTATTSEFRSGSTLNMSDSTVTYNILASQSGTVFSNSEAGSTWNISNSTLTLNCPNGAQVAIHAYFLPASVINNFTINGTASNVVWQMGYTSNNSKMTGFTYGGAIFGNGTSNILMDKYTYTGALTTIPNTFGASNKWWWVDPKMNAGGLFRWAAGSTSTGVSGFYGVIGFRPSITMDKTGYAPLARFTPSAMASRYPSFQATTTAFTSIALSNFFRDPTFMAGTDGFLPFVDSLDDKTIINTIDWVADFRQAGWVDQSVTYTAATAKYGTITSTISGAADVNYVNASTGAADAALISVNTSTKTISAVSGTLTWSPQRMYNALKNWWATYASNTDFLTATGGGWLDLGDYNTASNIRFGVSTTGDALTNVRTTGLINATTNDIAVTDSRGTSTLFSFVNVLNGSTVYLADNTGAQRLLELNTTATTYPVYIEPGASGNWQAKLRKYGYQSTDVTFTPPGGSYFIGSDNVVDTYVVDTLANVTAYTDLETTQKVYDYSSYWMTTTDGITQAKPFTKGFGTLTANEPYTLDPAAANLMAIALGVATTHTSGFNESVTILVTGNFTQGTATLSNSVQIRATNLDSELVYTGIDNITVYPTLNDAMAGTNAGASSNNGILRFLYGASLSGVTMSGTIYLRTTIGSVNEIQSVTLVQGHNVLDLSTTVLLQSIINSVAQVPTAVLAAQVETGATVAESLRLHNSVLGGKVSGGGSGKEHFRDLADTKDRLLSSNDAQGNRTSEVYDLT